MKKKIEVETYRFVGDYRDDIAKRIEHGKAVGTYTQTSIIKVLNENKQYVVGGKKIKSPINSSRQAYLISYGRDGENPEQIIKIIVDKASLANGDPNALAIEGMCQHSVNVKIKSWAIKTLCVTSMVVMMTGLGYGMIKADEREYEEYQQRMQEYIQDMNEERAKQGLPPLGETDFEYYYSESQENERSR